MKLMNYKTIINLKYKYWIVPILFFLSACSPTTDPNLNKANLVIINADIYTSDKKQPRAQALAIKNGKFTIVGFNDEIETAIGQDTKIIDAGNATIIPGLIDGHTHLVGGGSLATGVDLTDIPEKKEWIKIIAEKAATLPEGSWILGGRWNHNLSDGILPTKEMLDTVTPKHPVLLSDIDGHTSWANSEAIKLAGITIESPVPQGGEIVIDQNTGEPSGIFKERANRLFQNAKGIRESSSGEFFSDTKKGMRAAIKLANSLGITSMHDMSGFHDEFLEILKQGDLSLRVWQGHYKSISDERKDAFQLLSEEREHIRKNITDIGITDTMGPLFDIGYVKLMIDGVLSTRTALLNEPYSDDPTVNPQAFISNEALTQKISSAHEYGFPVAVHAIGDKGVSLVLDAFSKATPNTGALPDRIEHIELVLPEDIERFASLGVIASMQPHHATCCVGDYVIDRIGLKRLPYAYAWRSMLDQGVSLVLGTDWSTSPLNPFIQIADTIHRETRINGIETPWDEDNNLTFEEALYSYTQAGANVTSWADQIGSISIGKWADFVILDRKLPKEVGREIESAAVKATYLAGQQVYP